MNIYSKKTSKEPIEDDSITPEEQGFMIGYLEDLSEKN